MIFMQLLNEQYDKYYQDGEFSIYNKRFGKVKIPTNDTRIIQKAFSKLLKQKYKNETIKVLDYGCGDGRYFELFKNIAKQTKNKIEIISYDISAVGLKYYIQTLEKNGFEHTKFKKLTKSNENSFLVSVLSKNNLVFKILYGYEADSLENIEKLLGVEFDMVLCLFGVLSHIAKKEERIKHLKIFKNILNKGGRLILTVPGKGILKQELKCYSFLRKQGMPFMQALEEGDLYYKPNSLVETTICNYHHLYELDELERDLALVNFNKLSSGIITMLFPTKLKNIYLSKLDEYLSRFCSKFLPKKIQSKMSYLFIEVLND
jgi:SAM-dependent methyltransferase